MHTVELLEQALEAARRLGYQVRYESLRGAGSGACQIKGQRLLFLDPADSPLEQLQTTVAALEAEPDSADLSVPAELARLMNLRRAA